jgi:hypothetical protein
MSRVISGRGIASAAKLRVLIAAIGASPIVVRLREHILTASEWARIRRSPEVDAYVLAWIASHVREPGRAPRRFM